ncbi:MAG: hypothetical protein FWE72_08205 [Spirochaetaceae bacterium]|nr:hypothetical protein [Spirochaetaceae bacterium]
MKKILIVLPFLILFLFSCKSAPAPTDLTDGTTVAEKAMDIATAKGRAVDAMDKAKSIKADVAVSDEYNSALDVFNDAEKEAQSASNLLVATDKYLEAERLFLAAYESARVKKEEALRQLNKAKEDIRQLENEAEAFDKEQSGEEPAQDDPAQGVPAR